MSRSGAGSQFSSNDLSVVSVSAPFSAIDPSLIAGSGVAVHDRQLDIHQDKIRPLFCYGSERLLAVLGLRDS
jgi:hypothetical protein